MTQPTHLLLTAKEIEEFRRIVKERCGVALSADEAVAVAQQLLRVLKIVRDVGTSDDDQPR